MRFKLLVVIVPILFVGCRQKVGDALVLEVYPRPASPVRVYYKNELVHQSGWRKSWRDNVEVKMPTPFATKGKDGKIRIHNVRIEILTPEGWERSPLPTRVEESMSGGNISILVSEKEWKSRYSGTELLVDNREHKAVEITCGKIQINVSPNSKARYEFRVPNSPEAAKVFLNGKEIGTVSTKVTNNYLIDTSGRRSYMHHTIRYAAASLTGHNSRTKTFQKSTFHEIRASVEYFLEKPPAKIKGGGAPQTFGILSQN